MRTYLAAVENPRTLDRVYARVEMSPSDCWMWTGATTRGNYGVMGVGGQDVYLVDPSLSLVAATGERPEGMDAGGHRCHDRAHARG